MYKQGKYKETDKMSDLICENYPMVLVMSRFGIDLGFGEKTSGMYADRTKWIAARSLPLSISFRKKIQVRSTRSTIAFPYGR